MIPHLVWLERGGLRPLTYAGDVYGLSSRAQSIQLVLGYIGHNLALLAVPVALAALALAWTPRRWTTLARQPLAPVHARMVARRERKRECVAGAQCLDHPDRGRGRTRRSAA